MFEYSELLGQVQLMSTLLLSEGPYKTKAEKNDIVNIKPKENSSSNSLKEKNLLPQTVISAVVLSIKILNSIARIDLNFFQNMFSVNQLLQDSIYHCLNYIMNYSIDNLENAEETKELLHETLLFISYFTLLNSKLQNVLLRGEITIAQRIVSLPFNYFCDKKLKEILFPTIMTISYDNIRCIEILGKEINFQMLILFLKEKISLEPIVEEDHENSINEDVDDIPNLIKISNESFHTVNVKNETKITKKRAMSISSNASSTKSCHDMINAVSDFIPLIHRFPREYWEKALDFYSKDI